MKKYRAAGFTLIEMLAVLAVMAMLMAMAMPAFKGIAKSAKIETALDKVRSVFLLARQEAAVKQTVVYIVFPSIEQDTEKGYRSYAVFSGEEAGEDRKQLSDWYYLPDGIYFDIDPDKSGNIFDLKDALYEEEFPPNLGFDFYAYLKFKPDGTVGTSGNASYPRVYIYDAVRVADSLVPKNENTTLSSSITNSVRINNLTGLCKIIRSDGTL